jgi:hypothetical protein
VLVLHGGLAWAQLPVCNAQKIYGTFMGGAAGDVVVQDNPGMIQYVLQAAGLQRTHAIRLDDHWGWTITHNTADPGTIGVSGCGLDASSLKYIAPGILERLTQQQNEELHGVTWGHEEGLCVKGASSSCDVASGGYMMSGYSDAIWNSQCSEFMKDSCHVAMPTTSYPRFFSQDTVLNAATLLFNATFDECTGKASMQGWNFLKSLFCGGSRTDICTAVANQVVNEFMFGHGTSNHTEWQAGRTICGPTTPDDVAASPGHELAYLYSNPTWYKYYCTGPGFSQTRVMSQVVGTYGRNCGGATGNDNDPTLGISVQAEGLAPAAYRYEHVVSGQRVVDTQSAYLIDPTLIVDPCPGTAKTYDVTWNCAGGAMSLHVNTEAGGTTITPNCFPRGAWETATCTTLSGWACDPAITGASTVQVYDGSTLIATATANLNRPDVAAACPNGTTAHGWSIATPASLRNGLPHSLHVNIVRSASDDVADYPLGFNGQGNVSLTCCADTCASLGYQCGTQTVCGAAANCGSCPWGSTCSSGRCVCNQTCAGLGYQCGTQTVCGVATSCGSCASGKTCSAGTCVCASPSCLDSTGACVANGGNNAAGTSLCTNGSWVTCTGTTNVWESDTYGQSPYLTAAQPSPPMCLNDSRCLNSNRTISALGSTTAGNTLQCDATTVSGRSQGVWWLCGATRLNACNAARSIVCRPSGSSYQWQPATCASFGYVCGNQTICGTTRNCGSCGTNFTCAGGTSCTCAAPNCLDANGTCKLSGQQNAAGTQFCTSGTWAAISGTSAVWESDYYGQAPYPTAAQPSPPVARADNKCLTSDGAAWAAGSTRNSSTLSCDATTVGGRSQGVWWLCDATRASRGSKNSAGTLQCKLVGSVYQWTTP